MDAGTDRALGRGALLLTISILTVIAATAAIIAYAPARSWIRQHAGWEKTGFTIGEQSHLRPEWYVDGDYSVLVFATENCDACRRSRTFHTELINTAATVRTNQAHVLLTSPADDEERFAAELGLAGNRVKKVDVTGTPVRKVPTIVIVDQHGIVREIKEGVLSESEQHALLEKIKTLR